MLFALFNCLAVLPAAAQQDEKALRLLALGDSLIAGYGLHEEEAFPVRLEQALRKEGLAVTVINGGVSGDTTAGGLARLDWSLADKPDVALVSLGANDGLRGLDPAQTQENLDRIITRLKERGVTVILAGMLAPPNLGKEYGAAFNAVYPRLAEKHGVPLYPFILEGVATRPELNQGDAIHPNARGVDVMVSGMLPLVSDVVRAKARIGG